MTKTYRLVNPYLTGNIENTFSGKSALDAASEAYNSLSENFNNNIPKFYFTLQKVNNSENKVGGGKNQDYFHFEVTEEKIDNQVNFRIKPLKEKIDSKRLTQFKKSISQKDLKGGKRKKKDDSSSSSSTDSDFLDDSSDAKYKTKYVRSDPIVNWFYDPYLYRLQKVYVPTFVYPVKPYIEISLIR